MTLKVVMHLMRHKTRVARVSFCQLFSSPFKLSPSHPRRHPRVLRAGADAHGQINLLALSNSMIARAYGNGLTHWHPNGSQAAASRARVWQIMPRRRVQPPDHILLKKRQPPAVWPGGGGGAYVLGVTRNDRGPSIAADCGARPFCPRPRLLTETIRCATRDDLHSGHYVLPSSLSVTAAGDNSVQILTSAHSSIRDMEVRPRTEPGAPLDAITLPLAHNNP